MTDDAPLTDPGETLIERFLDAVWMESGLSDNTLAAYRRDLQAFRQWLREQGHDSLRTVARHQVLDYLAYRMGQSYKPTSTALFVSCLRRVYPFLLRESLVEV